jgi:anti-sigma regulatory factor (Ser/Thr protein kinase)
VKRPIFFTAMNRDGDDERGRERAGVGIMGSEIPNRIAVSFPGELEYIPLVRKLISDVLQVLHFSAKFTFRSEFITDELCNNAVTYGSGTDRSLVDLICEAYNDRVEFTVKDRGGSSENIKRLRQAIEAEPTGQGGGLELVRMLADTVECTVNEKNLTQIHVVRKREDGSARLLSSYPVEGVPAL